MPSQAAASIASMSNEIAHSIHCADLFPVPFLIDNFGESARDLNRSLISDIDQEMEAQPISATRSFVSSWQSHSGLEQKYESFSKLQRLIEVSTQTYLHHIKYSDASATGCIGLWANYIAGKGGHSGYHIHGSGRVIATGVYYPASLIESGKSREEDLDNFDPARIFSQTGVGGELIVYDPSYAMKRQVIKPQDSHYYDGLKQISPRESLLIVFPQYLPHSVDPLLQDDIERYSISYTVEKV